MSTVHILETITPMSMQHDPGDASPLLFLLDCSCGAEIECGTQPTEADAIESAFTEHVPGEWRFVPAVGITTVNFRRATSRNLCGGRLVPVADESAEALT